MVSVAYIFPLLFLTGFFFLSANINLVLTCTDFDTNSDEMRQHAATAYGVELHNVWMRDLFAGDNEMIIFGVNYSTAASNFVDTALAITDTDDISFFDCFVDILDITEYRNQSSLRHTVLGVGGVVA